jgi:hypothetical protein
MYFVNPVVHKTSDFYPRYDDFSRSGRQFRDWVVRYKAFDEFYFFCLKKQIIIITDIGQSGHNGLNLAANPPSLNYL